MSNALPPSPEITRERARKFQQMHQQGLLLLANVWDAGSAALITQLGAPALATSSAGVAWSHGYSDAEDLPFDLLLQTVRSIVRVSALPLSVDIREGYSDQPDVVAERVGTLMSLGVVGINLEDGVHAPELLCEKIRAVRALADAQDIPLYINVRTDVFLRALVPADQAAAEVRRRASLYQAAGGSGLFVPGLMSLSDMAALSDTGLPLNVLLRPSQASFADMAAAGVRRLSAGSALPEAAYGSTESWAKAFLEGAPEAMLAAGKPYGELNAALAR